MKVVALFALFVLSHLARTEREKVVLHEHDFYMLETTVDLSWMIQTCEAMLRNAKKYRSLKIQRSNGAPILEHDIATRVTHTIDEVRELSEHDFIVSDYIENVDRSKEEEDARQQIEIDKYLKTLNFNVDAPKRDGDHFAGFINALKREKRSLDFLGEAWHWLSGSPGPTEYYMQERMNEKMKIALLQENKIDEKMAADMNMYKTEIEQKNLHLARLFHEDDVKYNQLRNESIKTVKRFYLLVLHVKYLYTLDMIQDTIMNLKMAIVEAENGRLSRNLIGKDRLKSIVTKIGSKTQKLTPIFPISNVEQYYHLETTKKVRRHGKLLFYTRIPLIDMSNVYYLRTISLTTRLRTGISAEFILTSRDGLNYNTATSEDLRRLIKIGEYGYVSSERHVEISLKEHQSPESSMEHFWLERISRNTFRYQSDELLPARVKCHDKFTIVTLPKLGLIDLPEFCGIHCNIFSIFENEQVGLKHIYLDTPYNITDLAMMIREADKTMIAKLRNSVMPTAFTKNNKTITHQWLEQSDLDILKNDIESIGILGLSYKGINITTLILSTICMLGLVVIGIYTCRSMKRFKLEKGTQIGLTSIRKEETNIVCETTIKQLMERLSAAERQITNQSENDMKLRNIIEKLSSDNSELKKVIRDIEKDQVSFHSEREKFSEQEDINKAIMLQIEKINVAHKELRSQVGVKEEKWLGLR